MCWGRCRRSSSQPKRWGGLQISAVCGQGRAWSAPPPGQRQEASLGCCRLSGGLSGRGWHHCLQGWGSQLQRLCSRVNEAAAHRARAPAAVGNSRRPVRAVFCLGSGELLGGGYPAKAYSSTPLAALARPGLQRGRGCLAKSCAGGRSCGLRPRSWLDRRRRRPGLQQPHPHPARSPLRSTARKKLKVAEIPRAAKRSGGREETWPQACCCCWPGRPRARRNPTRLIWLSGAWAERAQRSEPRPRVNRI